MVCLRNICTNTLHKGDDDDDYDDDDDDDDNNNNNNNNNNNGVKHEETIDHLTSGCPILEKKEYLMRHDKDCTHLHYSICKALGNEMTDKWYTHMPKPV